MAIIGLRILESKYHNSMKKIKFLYLFNFIWYIILICIILFVYYSYLRIYNLEVLVFIVSILFTNIFLYSFLFIWIISKSKNQSKIWNFFSSWGRKEIKSNINEYYDGKYVQYYRKIILLSYVILALNICLIILIPLYINYSY